MFTQVCEDVPRARCILATHKPRTKLTNRVQEVHRVCTHVVLGHCDNSTHKGLLTVVVARLCADVAGQLTNLNFFVGRPLPTGVENLPLARLEPINHTGDRPLEVCNTEPDEVFVDELVIGDAFLIIVETFSILYAVQNPGLTLICVFLLECQLNGLGIFFLFFNVWYVPHGVPRKFPEIFLRFIGGTRTQTLIVLDGPPLCICIVSFPGVELGQVVELFSLVALSSLHNGSNHRADETGVKVKERWPEMVDEIDNQPLDVTAVYICICENHNLAIAEF